MEAKLPSAPNKFSSMANQKFSPTAHVTTCACYIVSRILNLFIYFRRVRAGFVSQQQTAGNHGGVASAVGGLCQHAALALEHMAARTMKKATTVQGGVASRDYAAAKELVTAAKSDGHVTNEEYNDVKAIVEGAERSNVWPVVETEPHQYMVLDCRSRTTELDWGSVKFDQFTPGEAPRRMTSSRLFMCKVRVRKGPSS